MVDGHHRVAMAKKLGQDYLDAHVVEYRVKGGSSATVPPPDTGSAPPTSVGAARAGEISAPAGPPHNQLRL